MKEETKWDGVDRRGRHFLHKVERFLVRFRLLSISVMVWSAWVMTETTFMVIELLRSNGDTLHLAAVLGALGVGLAPFIGIFKFAFDFALDGKIDNNI